MATGIGIDSIVSGLNAWRPVAGRGVTVRTAHYAIVDDTYNANPDSVRAAIDPLRRRRPRVLILGDMGEVGTGRSFTAGRSACTQRGIEALLALGR